MGRGKTGVSLVLLAAALAGLSFICRGLSGGMGVEDGTYEVYDRHYVMISGDEDSELWDTVYASALEEGKARGAYVERFGDSLAVNYDRNRLLEIAVQASVDGIIVVGDEKEETVELINRAVESGIPVVTVFQDSTGSLRQCFVGSNNYNVGQEYGRQILEILSGPAKEGGERGRRRVVALVDESRADTSQNLILLGIRETLVKELGEDYPVSVETMPVDNTRSFSPEESIRDIFLDTEEMPDILVCLNEVYTRCVCQAAVDYNKVGTMRILGYYDSDTILNAVTKNIIDATIAPDVGQMGRLCVQALDEYVETGYTNGYMAVDTRLITADSAKALTAAGE